MDRLEKASQSPQFPLQAAQPGSHPGTGSNAGNGAKHSDAHDSHEEVPTDLPKVPGWMAMAVGAAIVVIMIVLFFIGWVPRERRIKEADEMTANLNNSKTAVQIAQPKRTEQTIDLILPADARANQETSIFARSSGYLNRLLADVGDKVTKGQLLAEIEAPDVDADLNQSKAALAQAQANQVKAQDAFSLAEVTYNRYNDVAPNGGVTQQQLDEQRASYTQARSEVNAAIANVKAADAAVQRFVAMQGFEKVYAPFSGTITARGYDVGALMDSTNTTGKELFHIADADTLRVFINVPQSYVTSVKIGQKAFVSVRNYPGREFTGTIERSASALDPTTRTLQYQIDLPNKDGTLSAGMYAQSRLQVKQEKPPLTVPTSAVVFDSTGTTVWTIDDNKAHAKKVTVGRDFGTEVEISSGLEGGESVVTNPGARLTDGGEVLVTNSGPAAGQAAPQQAAAK